MAARAKPLPYGLYSLGLTLIPAHPMAIASFRVYAAALLVSGLALPAPAQTARIAHLSHGGSLETLAAAEALDNFGLPSPKFIVDSIRFLSDTTALEYGTWRWARGSDLEKEKVRTHKFSSRQAGDSPIPAKKYVEQKARYQPALKVLAYDTLPAPAPVLKKQKTKRKKAALLITLPAEPPRQYGLWLGAACVLGLAGAGWLLGGRAQPGLAPAHG